MKIRKTKMEPNTPNTDNIDSKSNTIKPKVNNIKSNTHDAKPKTNVVEQKTPLAPKLIHPHNFQTAHKIIQQPDLKPDPKQPNFQLALQNNPKTTIVTTDTKEDTIKLNDGYSLHPYQLQTLEWIKEKRNGIVCLTMGMGKSVISLYRVAMDIQESKKDGISRKTLVICSKTIIGEWLNDLTKFFGQHFSIRVLVWHAEFPSPGLSPKIHQHHLKTMSREDLNNYDLILTTYEVIGKSAKLNNAVERIAVRGTTGIHADKIISFKHPEFPTATHDSKAKEGYKLLHNYVWNRIIADEAQIFCNSKTKTFQSVCSLYGREKLCLTGTPVRNGDMDIWSLLFFCGNLVVDNPRSWTYHHFDKKVQSMILNLNYDAVIEKTPALALPTKKTRDYQLTLSTEEKKIYKYYFLELWELYKGFIEGKKDGERDFALILALFCRLRQICIAPYLMTSECKKVCYHPNLKEEDFVPLAIDSHIDPEIKLLAKKIHDINLMGFQASKFSYISNLILTLIENPDNFVLVFSAFTSVLRLLSLFFENLKIKTQLVDGTITGMKRQERLNSFRNGKYQILFLNYRVGAQGLNLTRANHVVTIEPWWSPVMEMQGVARAHRQGQTREVTHHRIIATGTIEEQINNIGRAKESILNSYLDSSLAGKREPVPSLDKWTLEDILRKAWKDIENY